MEARSSRQASSSSAGSSDSPRRRSRLKKWHGHQRTASLWDGLRKDGDLWYDEGDCLVFLYADTTADRGPCFKIPWSLIKAAQCMPLLAHSSPPNASDSGLPSAEPAAADADTLPSPTTIEIHLTAPKGMSTRNMLRYHITTRNFFAWVCGKPLVGNSLAQALVDLLHRMKLYRARHVENVEDLLIYADDLGYSHVECCPDHALAMLCFAESHKLPLVWTDAFAHCVGMNDELSTSPEFGHVSCVTRALITRASLEMDMHITKASRSLADFLQEELSPANLGLAPNARTHLDNFRSFLLSNHGEKYGCWPPAGDATFPKRIFLSMFDEFQRLYEHMADRASENSLDHLPSAGGISVTETLDAFNERNNHARLPFSMPVFPSPSSSARTSATRSLRQFALQNGGPISPSTGDGPIAEARYSATGRQSASCLLVQRYKQFETHVGLLNDGISAVEACKVRWTLVYCILQTVRSVLSAAEGVRASDAPYALCVLTTGLPPWRDDSPIPCDAQPTDDVSFEAQPEQPVTAVELAPEGDTVQDLPAFTARRNSSSLSLSKLATTETSSTRSASTLASSRRRSTSRSHRRSNGSQGSITSIRSDATVVNSPTAPARPPSLPRGLFELGEVNTSFSITEDAVEIDQLVPPPGADDEVVAQALARIGRGNSFTNGPSLAGANALSAFAQEESRPDERSPTLEASHLDFSDGGFENLSPLGQGLYSSAFERTKFDPDEQYSTSRLNALEAHEEASSAASPVMEAHVPVDAYESSRYDALHLDSAPVGSLAYESSDELTSLDWGQKLPESPGIREVELCESDEFDSMSLPSLDPGTPSPSFNRHMTLGRSKRHSSGLFSSLRSSRSFSTIYKFPDVRVGKAPSASRLSQTMANMDEGALSGKRETQIARQPSGRERQPKANNTLWIADF